MRLGKAFGVPVRLNLLSIPMLALMLWLENGRELLVLTASIVLHEAGHVAAARLLGVRVVELELMPVGGAARLESVWRLRPGQLILTALAGPAVNVLIAVNCLALAPHGNAALCARCARLNLTLALFNMMPALPADGGRILCGLIERWLPPARAAKIGVRLGMGMACILMIAAANSLRQGRFNITPMLAALFMLLTVPRELTEAGSAVISSLIDRGNELKGEGTMPVRLMAVDEDTTLREALARMKAREVHLFLCFDQAMEIVGWLTEEDVLRALDSGGEQAMGAVCRQKNAISNRIYKKVN